MVNIYTTVYMYSQICVMQISIILHINIIFDCVINLYYIYAHVCFRILLRLTTVKPVLFFLNSVGFCCFENLNTISIARSL